MLLNCGVKTLESPLDCKEIQPVHPKGDQSWKFIGRTDVEAETPILWQPDAKSWLIWKDPEAGKDWRQEEKGTTEDEMVGWHHWLNGREFESTLGVGDGQGVLARCSPWGHRVRHDWATELNWTERQWNNTFFKIWKWKSLSHVQLFVTSWTVAARLLCPWNFSGQNTGVGSHPLLQGIFPTQGSNPGLPHCRQIFYRVSHQG